MLRLRFTSLCVDLLDVDEILNILRWKDRKAVGTDGLMMQTQKIVS